MSTLNFSVTKSSSAASDQSIKLPNTPMMRQFQQIRQELPSDVMLFFRLGDFYELFANDAQEAAAILKLTLTKRGEVPMCGVPYHAAEGYIGKLIAAGHRVAICDQKGEVRAGQLVEREVTRILSAGTVTESQMLDAGSNHYLAAAYAERDGIGFAYLDLTTGSFRATELESTTALLDELARVLPKEILVAEDVRQQESFQAIADGRAYDAHAFSLDQAQHTLRQHFKVQSLDGFGFAKLPRAICAAGAILHYLQYQMRCPVEHITALKSYRPDQFLILDVATQSHLELVQARSEGGCSLRSAVDRTKTAMGARLLRNWLLYPLHDLNMLQSRQDFIERLLGAPGLLEELRETLQTVADVERAIGRLNQASGNARDLAAIRATLEMIPQLKMQLAQLGEDQGLLARFQQQLHELPELNAQLRRALVDEPPATLRDGGIFKDHYHSELDELRSIARDGQAWIAQFQEKEIQRTGIKSLKIRYNSVFGYYIEVTKSNIANVPAEYQRKQTTVNGERYITPELKDMEARLLGAEERAKQLEKELFAMLRSRVLLETKTVQQTAVALAALDALAGLAEVARQYNYCRPVLKERGPIRIQEGRHPVLEQRLTGAKGERFVPNDLYLDDQEHKLMILTGPNMAGKSTYLRQTALLVLLAQIGSFIPATQAEIGLVDRIFTRVGASDDLARGQSTFLVEMNETANIVHHATERSLVVLDEIGRGTSTYDGLSIAWSVAEYLLNKVAAKTLFATHYHELTELKKIHKGVQNYTVAVREVEEEILFLHQIVQGAADKSYGIHVARLAGLPKEILDRANQILTQLESGQTRSTFV